MKVLNLKVDNFMRVESVEITPDGSPLVIVNGDNEQGKTSTLNAIWAAVSGSKFKVDRPVRDGNPEASIRLDLGEIIVSKVFRDGTSKLVVTSAAGARFPSPQKLLDSLVGALAFDPLAFAQAPPKDQLALLLQVVELGFDPKEMAEERQGLFDQRTEVNRETKRLAGVLSGIPVVNQAEPVDLNDLVTRLDAAQRNQDRMNELRNQYSSYTEEIQRYEAALAELKLSLKGVMDEAGALQPRLVDPAPLREQLAGASAINEQARQWQQRQQVAEQHRASEHKAAELSTSIEQLDAAKQELIAAAAMPVEGMSFDEEGVLLDGVPFSQASAARRLRTSVQMAMTMNPKLRVIRVVDGSLLDSRSMQLLSEMAAEHDYQVWVERVGQDSTIGITIEDGKVQS